MALIVEDGTGMDDAESYISVADADAYFAARGYTNWATMSEAEKEQALRRGTDFMVQAYRLRWKGTRVSAEQALDWPRNWVEFEDYAYVTMNGAQVIGGFLYYPSNEVPEEVKRACAEMAFRAAAGDLAPDLGRRTIREKVDVLEVQYDPNSPQYVIYRAIDNMLAPFLGGGGSSTFRKVVRS